MYGLILKSICDFIADKHGNEKLEEILGRINHNGFNIHEMYSEDTVTELTTCAVDVTGIQRDELMTSFGEYFISNVHRLHLDPRHLLPVLGRHLRDFFNGLDNLHEYMRSVYPKMSPPSFFCERETPHGLTLHYRSSRRGYVHYVIGQIRHIALKMYSQHVDIEIIGETLIAADPPLPSLIDVVLQLHFENVAYEAEADTSVHQGRGLHQDRGVLYSNGHHSSPPDQSNPATFLFGECPMTNSVIASHSICPVPLITNGNEQAYKGNDDVYKSKQDLHNRNLSRSTSRSDNQCDNSESGTLPNTMKIPSETFFEGFPFHLLFDDSMMIRHVGSGLNAVLPELVGQSINDAFSLVRPLVAFSSENILKYTNNIFEIKSTRGICPRRENKMENWANDDDISMIYPTLKGQMIYIAEWNSTIYLCTPMMKSVEQLSEWGLFLHDLSIHDSSRDMLLVSKQYDADLKMAAEQEKRQGIQLIKSEKTLKKLIQKTDCLLHKMMPESIADRMRMGDDAVNTLQVFDSVTILFCDIVEFTKICSAISPMAVIEMLNSVYTAFDSISVQHSVYKVETIGDAYMVVSGAPDVTPYHAEHICNMAFDMLTSMRAIHHPTTGKNMRIRIGVHSGSIVAGVVAVKMKRYCLFGKTVNIATKMETCGHPMKIHISEKTKTYLEKCLDNEYVLEENKHQHHIEETAGTSLKTFWVIDKLKRPEPLQHSVAD